VATRVPLDEATIIDMAAQLLDSHGADKLTLTLIANHLGVTQPALYKHVEGIDAVWRGLGLRERAELESRLAAATIGLAGDDAVWAIANAWRGFSAESTSLYAIGDRYPVAGDDEHCTGSARSTCTQATPPRSKAMSCSPQRSS